LRRYPCCTQKNTSALRCKLLYQGMDHNWTEPVSCNICW